MKRLAALLLVATTLAAQTPPEHRRPPDQTFLTFPEWFLVFSPAEYAAFTREHVPSRFPSLGHIAQFWRSYDAVWNATRGRYPFNGGYHVMILVIGTSTTVEYAVRAAYETLIGRLAELTRRHGMTAEERLAATYAQEYVDFIRVRPWYEFDFATRLRAIWTRTGMWGRDPLRKWERKYALTSEYGAKAIYGWMIMKATHAAYETPLPVTAAVIDRAPSRLPDGVTLLRALPDGALLVTLPRYEGFTIAASQLARDGVQFREVAGNRGPILLSVLQRGGDRNASDGLLLRQPILTEPGTERLLVQVPVASLSAALARYTRPPYRVEHVFDY
ncbi:MAG TPA: hypothetical protein VF824_22900 [Thermoanaerobaculia bacterium]|jgi:hypothetical protein